jgi:hypothetical protein
MVVVTINTSVKLPPSREGHQPVAKSVSLPLAGQVSFGVARSSPRRTIRRIIGPKQPALYFMWNIIIVTLTYF